MPHLTPALRRLAPLLVAFAAAGCALLPDVPAALDPSTPVVTVVGHGGRCVDGECRWEVRFLADGSIVRRPPGDPARASEVEPARWAEIRAAIDATDWDAVRSHPFLGQCPTAWDGQERIWTFRTPRGSVELASCTVAIDEESEPFRMLGSELFASGG